MCVAGPAGPLRVEGIECGAWHVTLTPTRPRYGARRLRKLLERKAELEKEREERLQQSPPGDTALLDWQIRTLQAEIENLSL